MRSCCLQNSRALWSVLAGKEYNTTRSVSGYVNTGHAPFRPRPGVVDLPDGAKVEYLTDVEGNWEYFVEALTVSEVMYWTGQDRGLWGPGELCLKDDCFFVFGGDAPDKGPGDMRVVKTLLSLKKRYPNRCFLLLGNRDVNKLRFYAELDDEGTFLPYWNKPVTYQQYLEKHEDLEASTMTTLKWMLDDMGCQTTFLTRRRELALLLDGAEDSEVLDSFRNSVDPTGRDPWMLSLMIMGHIAVIIGHNLFVHAGLPKEAIGRVPGSDHFYEDAREWVTKLNKWKDDCLKEYVAKPGWRPGKEGEGPCERLSKQPRRRGGDALIDYGTPGGNDGRSVMYLNPFVNGNPVLPAPEVVDYLQRSGIKVVLSGHQPHGQTPTVVRHPETDLLCITADTSYSDMKAAKGNNIANNRGSVINWVCVTNKEVRIRGNTLSGEEHDCRLKMDPADDIMPDALVGRQLTDGSWVKAVKKDTSREIVFAARGVGFQVAVHEYHYAEALFLLAPAFVTQDLNIDINKVVRHHMDRKPSTIQYTCEDAEEANGSLWPVDRAIYFDREDFWKHDTFIVDGHGTLFNVTACQTNLNRGQSINMDLPPTPLNSKTKDITTAVVASMNKLLEAGKRAIFVTNSSLQSRAEYAEKIKSLGIRAPPGRDSVEVITTSYTCAWFCSRIGVKRPFVLTSSTGLLDELRMAGITEYFATIHDDGKVKPEFLAPAADKNIMKIIEKTPQVDAVVVGWDQQLTCLKIAVAATYVRWGEEEDRRVPIIGCAGDMRGVVGVTGENFLPELGRNDRTIPGVGNGAMTQAICSSVGDDCTAIDVGKPSQNLLLVMRTPVDQMGFGVDMTSAVVIGDTLDSDMMLAHSGQMKSLLLLSGVTTFDDLILEDDVKKIPTWLLPSLDHIDHHA